MPLAQSFVPVNKSQQHVKGFNCGNEDMNNFLSRFSSKHMSAGLSMTWVLPDCPQGTIPGKNGRASIAAYYTLSQCSVARESLPVQKSLPKYPIPVAMLGRLAVDLSYQGKGIGGKTLIASLRHAHQLCQRGLPAVGLVLDVVDDNAYKFYESFDLFEPLTDNPWRLFTSMSTIAQI